MKQFYFVLSVLATVAVAITAMGISPTNLGADGVAAIATPLAIVAAGTAVASALAGR